MENDSGAPDFVDLVAILPVDSITEDWIHPRHHAWQLQSWQGILGLLRLLLYQQNFDEIFEALLSFKKWDVRWG